MSRTIGWIHYFVWGIPMLALIISAGVYLTMRTGFIQFRLLPKALGKFINSFTGNKKHGSSYRALCTALAATIGTGNLVGVAGAIAIGGPGSIFWMWICAFLGMGIKFAESTLSVHYQQKNEIGETVGGPMYIIQNGLDKHWHWLAKLYCFMGVFAALGVGNATQVNAITGSIQSAFIKIGWEYPQRFNIIIGICTAVFILFVFRSGSQKIGNISERLVPFASGAYLIFCISILIIRHKEIPGAVRDIIWGAFHPRAVTGGAIGTAFAALKTGVSRGLFSNEAGMGTASIAHGSASVEHPVCQGLMGITEVFIDTIVICTLSALVILCSGVNISYGADNGVAILSEAFSQVCGDWASVFIAAVLCCFAFATILGWGFYGGRCAQYLIDDHIWKKFAFLQAAAVIWGAVAKTNVVWEMAETVNGLMAVPNLISLFLLSPVLTRLVREYISNMKNFKDIRKYQYKV